MSHQNYTLEIVSHHSQFNNKTLRKYYVDGIDTVGVWGNEPFEIRFKNNTFQKIQVKITLDGTDILTGKPADTKVSKDMWVVNGYGTLNLKAWPEDNNGGAGFVFTSADNSVAVHTHGDLSSRGIIAAAVFTEGHVEPYKPSPVILREEHHHWPSYPTYPVYPVYPVNPYSPIWIYQNGVSYNAGTNVGGTRSRQTLGGNSIDSSTITSSISNTSTSGTFSCDINDSSITCNYLSDAQPVSASLESLVSVGAGEHVDQKITYVAGLIKPVFAETVRVKYLWWDDLVTKLRTETSAKPQPSGFPGSDNQKNIDLRGTPRIGDKKGSFRRTEQPQQVFDRF
jgi:hypothetical protein